MLIHCLVCHTQMEGAAAGTEPWFAFDYLEAPLPPPLLQQWAAAEAPPELALPQRNAFIASDFGLVSENDGAAAADAAAAAAAADGTGGSSAPTSNGIDHPQVSLHGLESHFGILILKSVCMCLAGSSARSMQGFG